MTAGLDRALRQLPHAYPGPGGACAVLHRGEVMARHAWGWANAELRIPFTPRTLFRLCSITKQFTCGVLLDAYPDPAVLDEDVRTRLPLLDRATPAIRDLCHNQSGLRDYWAVAMLHGAPVESPFGATEATRVIRGTRSLQFAPGTRYSYANQNFRLLSDILEERTGRSFAELLRTRIFDRAGMADALLAANTAAMPDGTQGYEGTRDGGFRAAENHLIWTGDAGLGATLDDMIAWERHIDATRDDADSLYRRLSAPVSFADGASAAYGFGLSRRRVFGRETSGHGGALRGWRSHRLHVPAERLSVVVLLNHLSDAHAAAVGLLAATLNETARVRASPGALHSWLGAYVEPQTGLTVRIDAADESQVRLRFGHSAERLDVAADGTVANDVTRLRRSADGVWMDRIAENQSSLLTPLQGSGVGAIAGRYRCAELEAEIEVVEAGGVPYAAFCGFLGRGRMELLEPVGLDVWTMPCPRALDHTPPGDWTLAFRRNAGRPERIDVGCWLARGLAYVRVA